MMVYDFVSPSLNAAAEFYHLTDISLKMKVGIRQDTQISDR